MNFFHLPRGLWWSHHLAFLLHDHLAQVVVRGEEKDLFWIRVSLHDEAEARSFQEIGDGDVIEWLRQHGRNDEANSVIERTLVHGLLADMCQFLFESIECAAKGKMAVAFALLRKPFRDQLFLLEWILSDRDGFLREFSKGPTEIDPSGLLQRRRDWMKQTVKSSMSLSNYSEFVDFDFMWESRAQNVSNHFESLQRTILNISQGTRLSAVRNARRSTDDSRSSMN